MWQDVLASRVLDALVARGETLATAESLTGGLLASGLTDVPGASRCFVGGVVSYATRVKVTVLDVPEDVVDRHGVISEECATAMALGVRDRLGATYGVATTGVAGPDLQDGKLAGTVWLAVAGPEGISTRLLTLSGDRRRIREGAADAALELVAEVLGGILPREETPLR
jgi:PncC family amidohydrolase